MANRIKECNWRWQSGSVYPFLPRPLSYWLMRTAARVPPSSSKPNGATWRPHTSVWDEKRDFHTGLGKLFEGSRLMPTVRGADFAGYSALPVILPWEKSWIPAISSGLGCNAHPRNFKYLVGIDRVDDTDEVLRETFGNQAYSNF